MSDADQDALSKLVVASRSDVGRSRSENQDALGDVSNTLGERLLIVADGMGGHQGGAQASAHCVESVQRVFLELHDPPDDRLTRGLEEANADVYQAALDDDDLSGMGATAVAFLLSPDGTGWVAWVGDSRLYRLRGDELRPLTDDHSLVAQWVKLGVLSADEAAGHPKRNELTRAIGVTPEVEVDLLPIDLRPGDRYLLCSDGLCGVIDDASIHEALAAGDAEQAAGELIELANAAGGPDNVTVQIAWLRDEEPEEDEAPVGRPAEEPPLELDLPESAAAPGPPDPFAGPTPGLASGASPAAAGGSELEVPGTGLDAPRHLPRPERRPDDPRLEGHPPSILVGMLAGIALSMLAGAYLRWQQPPPPPAPQPRPVVLDAAPAGAAEKAPEPATPPAPAPAQPQPPPAQPDAALPQAPPPPAPAQAAPPAAPDPGPEPDPEPDPVKPGPGAVPDPGLAHPESEAEGDPGAEPSGFEARPPAAPDPPPAPRPPEPPASDVVIVGEIPAAGEVRWIPVPEPEPSAAAFDLEPELRTFLDAWLRALTRNDHAGHRELGFPVDAESFARTQSGCESYRLHAVDVREAGEGAQLHVRLVMSWAFYAPGGRRFRQEEERRLILERTPEGLRYTGLWTD